MLVGRCISGLINVRSNAALGAHVLRLHCRMRAAASVTAIRHGATNPAATVPTIWLVAAAAVAAIIKRWPRCIAGQRLMGATASRALAPVVSRRIVRAAIIMHMRAVSSNISHCCITAATITTAMLPCQQLLPATTTIRIAPPHRQRC